MKWVYVTTPLHSNNTPFDKTEFGHYYKNNVN